MSKNVKVLLSEQSLGKIRYDVLLLFYRWRNFLQTEEKVDAEHELWCPLLSAGPLPPKPHARDWCWPASLVPNVQLFWGAEPPFLPAPEGQARPHLRSSRHTFPILHSMSSVGLKLEGRVFSTSGPSLLAWMFWQRQSKAKEMTSAYSMKSRVWRQSSQAVLRVDV